MQYSPNILSLVGNTPLIQLSRVAAGVRPKILVKAEFLNPGGSIKDRIGLKMLEAAEKSGQLRKGGTIIEPTSGNTGVGLAQAAALKGYRCVFVMPDKMSADKVRLLKAYGAEVVIYTPGSASGASDAAHSRIAKRFMAGIRPCLRWLRE